MTNLHQSFCDALHSISIKTLDQSIFYNVPVGIRFEIGNESDVYLQTDSEKLIANPAYIKGALHRALTIYHHLPAMPNILCIRVFINPKEYRSHGQKEIRYICSSAKLPQPHEQYGANPVYLYWQLEQMEYDISKLFREITMGDLGGNPDFVSSVYLVNTAEIFLFHLYDDRGADVAAVHSEQLHFFYEHFNDWILDHDREKIDQIFKN